MQELDKEVENKGKRASDELLKEYIDAKLRYEFVSKELGDKSPAKVVAERKK